MSNDNDNKGTKAMTATTATNGFNVNNWQSIKRYLNSISSPKDLLLLKRTFNHDTSKRLGMAASVIDWVLLERGYTYSALVDQSLLD